MRASTGHSSRSRPDPGEGAGMNSTDRVLRRPEDPQADARAGQRETRRVAWTHLRSLLRPWRGMLVLVALSVLLAKVLDLVPPLLMQRVVDDHLTPGRATGLLGLGLVYLLATA